MMNLKTKNEMDNKDVHELHQERLDEIIDAAHLVKVAQLFLDLMDRIIKAEKVTTNDVTEIADMLNRFPKELKVIAIDGHRARRESLDFMLEPKNGTIKNMEVAFYCINKTVEMKVKDLIEYYINNECAEVTKECNM